MQTRSGLVVMDVLSIVVVVVMRHERDGIGNVVEYDLYIIVRDVKRKDAGPPCDEMFWSFDGAIGGDEVRNDEMGGKVR